MDRDPPIKKPRAKRVARACDICYSKKVLTVLAKVSLYIRLLTDSWVL